MRCIKANNYNVEIGPIEESSFSKVLEDKYGQSKKVIIVDENTHEHCLSKLITNFDSLSEAEVIVLPFGEENKQIEIAYNVWEALTEYGITRYDVIINLGGGMMTDMGGFIASCYKRGIDFINIPTSLLGMVDASIGGKTGVNLGAYKNQIGVFSDPVALYIDTSFLSTLPENELLSGYAEMLKHGLIKSEKLFNQVSQQLNEPWNISEDLLCDCIAVKNEVVLEDAKEKGVRKILNFGHTVGHIIEGYFLEDAHYSHGFCVAIGMVVEANISYAKGLIGAADYENISRIIGESYSLPSFSETEIDGMIALVENDKKNKDGKILCCLLKGIGECIFDQKITKDEIKQAFFDVLDTNHLS